MKSCNAEFLELNKCFYFQTVGGCDVWRAGTMEQIRWRMFAEKEGWVVEDGLCVSCFCSFLINHCVNSAVFKMSLEHMITMIVKFYTVWYVFFGWLFFLVVELAAYYQKKAPSISCLKGGRTITTFRTRHSSNSLSSHFLSCVTYKCLLSSGKWLERAKSLRKDAAENLAIGKRIMCKCWEIHFILWTKGMRLWQGFW